MLHWQSTARTGKVIPFEAVAQGSKAHSVSDVIDMMGARVNFDRNAEVFAEGEPADYLYKVISGVVRMSKLTSDGRRQIGAFYLPGDMFGLAVEGMHHFSAEAIVDSDILVVKRSAFMGEAARDPIMAAELWTETMSHLERAQNHMMVLGRKNAQERIAAFLLDMAERLSQQSIVELPMCRQDIADYLGLTIETVSRTLTQLERAGVIGIPVSRRIVLKDPAALGLMNDSLAA